VNHVVRETNELLKERFLQSWNAETIKDNAANNDVP
jgi:hypothetical protein